jgi:hypothetical protein
MQDGTSKEATFSNISGPLINGSLPSGVGIPDFHLQGAEREEHGQNYHKFYHKESKQKKKILSVSST